MERPLRPNWAASCYSLRRQSVGLRAIATARNPPAQGCPSKSRRLEFVQFPRGRGAPPSPVSVAPLERFISELFEFLFQRRIADPRFSQECHGQCFAAVPARRLPSPIGLRFRFVIKLRWQESNLGHRPLGWSFGLTGRRLTIRLSLRDLPTKTPDPTTLLCPCRNLPTKLRWANGNPASRGSYPGLFTWDRGGTRILPVFSRDRLETCPTAFVNIAGYCAEWLRRTPGGGYRIFSYRDRDSIKITWHKPAK